MTFFLPSRELSIPLSARGGLIILSFAAYRPPEIYSCVGSVGRAAIENARQNPAQAGAIGA